jgi:N-methylhydantoinase B/oxoprolinase/acetone carboxylase alpha subunit
MLQISRDFAVSLRNIKKPTAVESVLDYSGILRLNVGNSRNVLQTSIIIFFNGSLVVSVASAIRDARSKNCIHFANGKFSGPVA